MTDNRPAHITLPIGWTWERVEAAREAFDFAADMVPVATAPGVVAWGTIESTKPLWRINGTKHGREYTVHVTALDHNEAVRKGSHHPHMLCVRDCVLITG